MAKTQNIAIVTDSFACYAGFPGQAAGRVTIANNAFTVGGRRFRETVDLDSAEAVRLISQQSDAPELSAPNALEYGQIYAQIAHSADAIISIHASREISTSWANARAGALQVSHCPIAVIDSRTLSAGQAMLVRLALSAIDRHLSFDEIARLLRASVERVYSIFYVESIDFMFQNEIIEPAHAIIGSMLGLKPVITVENGRLQTMEKVKSRAHAIDRMVEFAIEFSNIIDAQLLQPRTGLTETGRLLQERLAIEVPNWRFTPAPYGASLAALLGTETTGLVILESELEP